MRTALVVKCRPDRSAEWLPARCPGFGALDERGPGGQGEVAIGQGGRPHGRLDFGAVAEDRAFEGGRSDATEGCKTQPLKREGRGGSTFRLQAGLVAGTWCEARGVFSWGYYYTPGSDEHGPRF